MMNGKALYNLSCGVFVLGTKSKGKINACITNTCMQVASNPVQVAISVLKKNLTCGMVKESGIFALSVLDSSCGFELIKNFGLQSGRDADKFKDFSYETAKNGCPYITQNACSYLECKVISSMDLDSHELFIAQVDEAEILGAFPPLAYSDYQNKVKPKPSVNSEKKIVGWKCRICGFVIMNPTLPDDYECPLCGHPKEDFEPIYEI